MNVRKKRDGGTRRRGDAARLSRPLFVAGSPRRRVSASVLFIAFCLFPFALSSSAHEPITTKVRFNKELVRILQRNCLTCHHPGGIAFSLATYDEARPWAKAIKEEVLEKRMPPWHAVKGYGDFRNAPTLTQRDIDLIVNWVEGGAPKGEDKDLPPDPLFSNDWQTGKPDLILKPQTESKIDAGFDGYRTFVLPTGLKEDRWLSAVDLQPGNASIVHCAAIYLLRDAPGPAATPMMQIGREESATGDLLNALPLATWMPGQKPNILDEGVGDSLPAGSRLAVKIHYRGSAEASADLSAIGLYFIRGPLSKRVATTTLTGPDSVIRVADEIQPLKMSHTVESDRSLIAIRPLVHPLLASYQATAYRPDGSQEVLIWTRGYQSDWSPTYYFRRAVSMPKGTRVEVIVYIDNSDNNQKNPNNPARPVRWSELTAAPWCVLLLAEDVR